MPLTLKLAEENNFGVMYWSSVRAHISLDGFILFQPYENKGGNESTMAEPSP